MTHKYHNHSQSTAAAAQHLEWKHPFTAARLPPPPRSSRWRPSPVCSERCQCFEKERPDPDLRTLHRPGENESHMSFCAEHNTSVMFPAQCVLQPSGIHFTIIIIIFY